VCRFSACWWRWRASRRKLCSCGCVFTKFGRRTLSTAPLVATARQSLEIIVIVSPVTQMSDVCRFRVCRGAFCRRFDVEQRRRPLETLYTPRFGFVRRRRAPLAVASRRRRVDKRNRRAWSIRIVGRCQKSAGVSVSCVAARIICRLPARHQPAPRHICEARARHRSHHASLLPRTFIASRLYHPDVAIFLYCIVVVRRSIDRRVSLDKPLNPPNRKPIFFFFFVPVWRATSARHSPPLSTIAQTQYISFRRVRFSLIIDVNRVNCLCCTLYCVGSTKQQKKQNEKCSRDFSLLSPRCANENRFLHRLHSIK
jgi:hypothetical protein